MFPHSKATKWGIPHFEANPSGEGRRFSLADVTNNTINSTSGMELGVGWMIDMATDSTFASVDQAQSYFADAVDSI